MRERVITGGVVLGLACFAAAFCALGYRNRGPCGIPETCRVPGALEPHPYAGYGYALVAIGLFAIAISVVFAGRRRTAG
jgi:hypothetical protein